jgi:hypothetical protein
MEGAVIFVIWWCFIMVRFLCPQMWDTYEAGAMYVLAVLLVVWSWLVVGVTARLLEYSSSLIMSIRDKCGSSESSVRKIHLYF